MFPVHFLKVPAYLFPFFTDVPSLISRCITLGFPCTSRSCRHAQIPAFPRRLPVDCFRSLRQGFHSYTLFLYAFPCSVVSSITIFFAFSYVSLVPPSLSRAFQMHGERMCSVDQLTAYIFQCLVNFSLLPLVNSLHAINVFPHGLHSFRMTFPYVTVFVPRDILAFYRCVTVWRCVLHDLPVQSEQSVMFSPQL